MIKKNDELDVSLTEQAVLSKVLALQDVSLIMSELKQEHFFVLKNKFIFQVANALFIGGREPDLATVITELENLEHLTKAGGIEYIATLGDNMRATTTKTEYLIEQLIDRYTKTFAKNVFAKSAEYIANNNLTKDDIVKLTDNVNRTIVAETARKEEEQDLETVIRNAMKKAREGRDSLVGSGVKLLDEMLDGGLERGEYCIIGARPGGGKSALALDFAISSATEGEYTMFATTEMGKGQIALRALSKVSQIPMRQLTGVEGYKERFAEEVIEDGIELLNKSKLMIYDNLVSLGDILAEYQRQKSLGKDIRVLVVDYIQQLQPDRHMAKASQYELLKDISNQLMRLAVDDQITVICCAQLRRSSNVYDTPEMGDILGCGAIEQDATKVITLGWDRDDNFGARAYLIKNRSGRTGKAKLKFYGACYSFYSEEQEEIENL